MNPPTEEQRQRNALILKQVAERQRTPEYKDMTLLIAKEAFERFTACMKAGFTVQQSMQVAIELWGK